MRYLVTTSEAYSPFVTDYFDPDNHFNKELGMIVYDLKLLMYTTDGINWYEISQDHL